MKITVSNAINGSKQCLPFADGSNGCRAAKKNEKQRQRVIIFAILASFTSLPSATKINFYLFFVSAMCAFLL